MCKAFVRFVWVLKSWGMIGLVSLGVGFGFWGV